MNVSNVVRLLLVLLSLVSVNAASAALPYTSSARQLELPGVPVPATGTPSNPYGLDPSSAVIGDFNNDGYQDLVVLTSNGTCLDASSCPVKYNYPTVLFFAGDALGYFGAASNGSNALFAGPPPQSIEGVVLKAADLNHDGNLDVVIAGYTDRTGGIFVSYGNGNGGFSAPAAILPIPGSYERSYSVTLRDVNHDGWIDIVVVDFYVTVFSTGSDLLVYLNDGHGHFNAYDQYSTSAHLYHSAVLADFGGDGNADVVGLDLDDGVGQGLVMMKGHSNGTFDDAVTKVPSIQIPAALFKGPMRAAAADLDADGCNDYVLGDTAGGVWWFRGHCNDTFDNIEQLVTAPVPVAGSGNNAPPWGLHNPLVLDINSDGRKDIAYAGNIFLRQADGTYLADAPTLCPSTSGWLCEFLAARDVNGDGRPELIANNPDLNKITIYTSSHGAATTLQVVGGNNQSTVFNTAFPQPLRVRVVDAGGLPVPGTEIWYTPPSGLTASALIPGGHGWTDAQGYFSTTATADNTVGCYSVDILVGAAGVGGGQFDLCNTAANSLLISSGTPQSALPSTLFAQPLVAQVLDGNSQPAAGIIVSFTAPSLAGGGASAKLATAIPGLAAATNTVTAVTDASGYASVFAQSNATTGTYNVSVSAPFYATTTGSFTLTNQPIPGAAAQVLLTPSTANSLIGTQYVAPLQAQIADSAGLSVSGTMASVTFAQANDPAAAAGVLMSTGSTPCTNGTAGPLTVPSNFQGQATIYVCANGTPGQFAVRAGVNDPNISEASATLRNRAPTPASIALYGGTPQTAPINTPFTQTLQVQVLTSGGQPASFAPVFFIAPSSGPSATLSATLVATDQNGIATVTATSNSEVGHYIVTARVIGDVANPTVDFALANGAPVAAMPVPTLSQWAMALLSMLLGLAGVWRRKVE